MSSTDKTAPSKDQMPAAPAVSETPAAEDAFAKASTEPPGTGTPARSVNDEGPTKEFNSIMPGSMVNSEAPAEEAITTMPLAEPTVPPNQAFKTSALAEPERHAEAGTDTATPGKTDGMLSAAAPSGESTVRSAGETTTTPFGGETTTGMPREMTAATPLSDKEANATPSSTEAPSMVMSGPDTKPTTLLSPILKESMHKVYREYTCFARKVLYTLGANLLSLALPRRPLRLLHLRLQLPSLPQLLRMA